MQFPEMFGHTYPMPDNAMIACSRAMSNQLQQQEVKSRVLFITFQFIFKQKSNNIIITTVSFFAHLMIKIKHQKPLYKSE